MTYEMIVIILTFLGFFVLAFYYMDGREVKFYIIPVKYKSFFSKQMMVNDEEKPINPFSSNDLFNIFLDQITIINYQKNLLEISKIYLFKDLGDRKVLLLIKDIQMNPIIIGNKEIHILSLKGASRYYIEGWNVKFPKVRTYIHFVEIRDILKEGAFVIKTLQGRYYLLDRETKNVEVFEREQECLKVVSTSDIKLRTNEFVYVNPFVEDIVYLNEDPYSYILFYKDLMTCIIKGEIKMTLPKEEEDKKLIALKYFKLYYKDSLEISDFGHIKSHCSISSPIPMIKIFLRKPIDKQEAEVYIANEKEEH